MDKNIENLIWKSEYNIGNLKIDQEHQKLFSIARKTLSVVKLNNDEQEIGKIKELITELFTYVGTHFSNEQKYMKEVKYPELENHILLHKNLLDVLTNLISQLNTMELKEIEKSLYSFIEEYFIRHIILEDKKINLWNCSLEDLKSHSGWKDIYSVNNEIIDKEHKELFNIAQEAFAYVEEKDKTKKIKEIVTDLYDYMKTHFSHEEKFMQDINYPKSEEHKKLHREIILKINEFVKQLPTMNISDFEKELSKIIDISLVHHIIQEDRKIIAWERMNPHKK
ncbi:hemerythrin (two domain) [Arcobacter acticola]|uniref:Hemerythrin (Two domain) n=1 Tax=Arcobacter acticola TaxID=1849015 RepID=A0A6M8EPJ0_9BACT|nr:bacteriohemerythrin [Arcobacter acticola]QKE30019.1 hemerythrin (two domain) [Arcobacter acticola]